MTKEGKPAGVVVLCAHGTRDPAGRETVNGLLTMTAEILAPTPVFAAYVDVQEPRIAEVVARQAPRHRVVVVPLLLGTGYHVQSDVARAVDPWPTASSTGALGPHPRLADLLDLRVRQAGASAGDHVVLGVAGSSRETANEDSRRTLAGLAERWAGPVSIGYAAGVEPSVADAVASARADGAHRVVVASYLLGRGFFHTLLRGAGADAVSEPLGVDQAVIDVILERYHQACGRA